MSLSAAAQALDLLKARLENITVANGYNHTIAIVRRAKLEPFTSDDLPSINYWPSEIETQSREYKTETKGLFVTVEAYGMTRDDPFTDSADLLRADIETAVHRDPSAPRVSDRSSLQMGDCQVTVQIERAVYAIGKGQSPVFGVITTLLLLFDTPLGDPFTLLSR